jgi:hypothetical protein
VGASGAGCCHDARSSVASPRRGAAPPAVAENGSPPSSALPHATTLSCLNDSDIASPFPISCRGGHFLPKLARLYRHRRAFLRRAPGAACVAPTIARTTASFVLAARDQPLGFIDER